MNKDLIISSNRHETKVAIVEDEQLVEIYFQHANEYSLVGSIHKGRVTRVLPGMQSAFVKVGLERDAFLYVSDFFEDSEEYEPIPEEKKASRQVRPPQAPAAAGASPSKEGPESRERRGRRSRRRRKGRDFPDSKYSGGTSAVSAPADSQAPEAKEPEAREDREANFMVLPGESVAKYERSGEEAIAPKITAKDGKGAPEQQRRTSSDPEGSDDGKDQKVNGNEESQRELIPAETAAVDEPESVPPEKATEDSDIQEMILGQIDKSVVEESQALANDEDDRQKAAGEAGGSEKSEETAEEGKRAEDGSSPRQETASVEERDSRYLRRGPRRNRRRSRNNQPEPGGKGEEAPPKAEGAGGEDQRSKTVSRPDRSPLPSISDLLKEGQEILVQIAKEPIGTKGARITSHIALPGRYVVYMPTLEHFGVSRKIASDEERQKLRHILQKHRADMPGGFIVRTAGEGKGEDDIAADMSFLFQLWMDIREKAEKKPAPVLLHHDLLVVERILRDQMTDEYRTIWVDNEEAYESVLQFLHRFQPSLVKRVRMYTRSAPIFEAFNITAELDKALHPKVWLKSGGYIVINQTEALVAIDINTGKFVGRSHRLEDTIVKTNIEAIQEIVRQMRLRDLGGIIVVDFIDMEERRNRQRVMQALEEAMRQDRAPSKVLQFNDFGLVAITRKRVKQSLERALCSPCPYCEGAGYVKSVDTTIGDIMIEAHKLAGAVKGEDLILRVHPDVAREMKSRNNECLQELEETLGCQVMINADPLLHHEKFDLA